MKREPHYRTFRRTADTNSNRTIAKREVEFVKLTKKRDRGTCASRGSPAIEARNLTFGVISSYPGPNRTKIQFRTCSLGSNSQIHRENQIILASKLLIRTIFSPRNSQNLNFFLVSLTKIVDEEMHQDPSSLFQPRTRC
ncbi:hypothetical protein EUGRSUZ_H05130 [Eucalyptus grandis]|uniref:Uncharacterized protein n=2 Tax=Eucalyptus grandis TaxID=71139 RepID=A0ACC3JZV5_EUCGR|nr:hypothetical protein EUGRSUZ_H05130 [Eucalyptus grandis]